ncbi:MAG: peptidoglycan editing factor PgeF [Bacteroidales bacterium]|nr:peptidoglycan editing factor PgeF [Bacteroidales bacterium]
MQISKWADRGEVFQSQLLLQQQGIEHYSTMRQSENAMTDVWMPHQVHGTRIYDIEQGLVMTDDGAERPEADAVVCTVAGQWIGVRTADCVPVLLFDPVKHVVAAVHAGWRGTVQHIVRRTLDHMADRYGCQMTDVWAMIGPSISPDAYEVGPEVAEQFVQADRAACIVAGGVRPHIDLWQSNVMDMMEVDVPLDHIDCSPICTYQHSDVLYSARREGIGTGRNVTAIRLKP